MKTTTRLLLALAITTLAMPAAAQDQNKQAGEHHVQTDSMMHGGMMHGDTMHGDMMQAMSSEMIESTLNDPNKRSRLMIRVIPTLAEKLNLSDEQSTKLEQIAHDYRQLAAVALEQSEEINQEVQELLAAKDLDTARLKTLLSRTAASRADIAALDVATAAAMEDELTSEQREKLTDMTPEQVHHHMMTNMTMTQMMEAMHGDMMGSGEMHMQKGTTDSMKMHDTK